MKSALGKDQKFLVESGADWSLESKDKHRTKGRRLGPFKDPEVIKKRV